MKETGDNIMSNFIKKNVLMATLSTFLPNKTLNYYFYNDDKNTEKCICTGITSFEAGSKYILSTVSIDKIVIIPSE